MLKRLTITNYLLIETLELDCHTGLTAITGETGSGKSILIGAVSYTHLDVYKRQRHRFGGLRHLQLL